MGGTLLTSTTQSCLVRADTTLRACVSSWPRVPGVARASLEEHRGIAVALTVCDFDTASTRLFMKGTVHTRSRSQSFFVGAATTLCARGSICPHKPAVALAGSVYDAAS